MNTLLVSLHVKPESVDEFKAIALDNAKNSLQEPGVARFDIVRQADDGTRFLLIETYRSAEAMAQHKQTPHYNRWREAVEPLLAEPRTRVVYENVFPDESGWG
jgi:quinol monooxygenase YgiN